MFGGFSLGATFRGNSRVAPIDPATLNLSVWLKPDNYDDINGNWTGEPSTGNSGSDSWSEPTNFPAKSGTYTNGYQAVQFDGASSNLQSIDFLSALIGAGGDYTITMLIKPASVSTYNNADYTQNAMIISMFGDGFDILCTDPASPTSDKGIILAHMDPTLRIVSTTVTVGSWNAIDLQFNSSSGLIRARTNGGTWASTTASALSTTNHSPILGRDQTSTYYYDGDIMEFIMAPSALSDATLDGIRSYWDNRYAQSL